MTDVQPIPVYRPTFLTDGGEFRGSLIEAPANIFYQQVKASRATLNRLQFQWRSVSDNLLLSPTAMLRMRLRVTCPQTWNHLMSLVSVHGVTASKGAGGNLNGAHVYTAAVGHADAALPCQRALSRVRRRGRVFERLLLVQPRFQWNFHFTQQAKSVLAGLPPNTGRVR